MPVISAFYGLIILMYYLDNKKHHLPHIHVQFGNYEAVYQIPEAIMIEGNIPKNKQRLVEAWIEIHQEELMANWTLAISGNEIFKIDPLK